MDRSEAQIRQAIIAQCLAMNASGLNQGTSGNISVRYGAALLITPSGLPYDRMQPQDIVRMPFSTRGGHCQGSYEPSTEWPMHFDILTTRPQVGAIVHAHSPFATVLAIARREIPAVHYMIAAFGGASVRCAEYATFGTQELSRHALAALTDREACLLANHGMLTVGNTLEQAMWRAVELETLACQYYHSLLIGGGHILADSQIATVKERFSRYGPKR